MSSARVNNRIEPIAGSQLAPEVLARLAERARASGIMFAAALPDGTVYYADDCCAELFKGYAAGLMQSVGKQASEQHAENVSVDRPSAERACEIVPGVLTAAEPYSDRKGIDGFILAAAKSVDFSLNDPVIRHAAQFGLELNWLNRHAQVLPGYGPEALSCQVQVLRQSIEDCALINRQKRELESLSTQLSNTYEELSLIYQLSSGMKVNRAPADFFRQACSDVMGVLDVRGMGVALRGEGALNQPPTIFGEINPQPGELDRLTQYVMDWFESGKSVLLVNHLHRDPALSFFAASARQLLAVPLTRGRQLLGCLFAMDKRVDEFNSVDSKLLGSIGDESAVYLENTSLFEDVHELVMGLLHSLTSAVDAKDAYTCGHSERVALISRHLALAAGMSEQQADRIYMAGLLHDVGKIGVPEGVLQKTGKLTAEEFEQIKRHPDVGARILRDIKQIEDLIPGVLRHHERYDGKGYPGGLAGDAIPLMGRIICLADCFDAMTSSRTYRKALPVEVALMEIRRCAGTQFDPMLADAFVKFEPDELRDLLKNHSVSPRRMLAQQPALRAA